MTGLKSAGNIMLYTLGEMIPRVLSFLLLPVLTRYLSTADYGISSYITTVASFLFVLTSLSVNTYALRGYYKIPTEENRKKLLGNLFIFLNAWALIMLLAEIILFPFLLKAFSVQVPFYPFFFMGLVINFFDVSAIIPLIYFRINENAKGFVLLSVGRTVLQYLLVILFVVFFKQGLYGSFMGRLIACIPFGLLYFFIVRKNAIFHFDLQQVKNALIFSLPLLPGVISYLVVTIFDRIILERYVSLNELGIYSIASTLALALNIMIQGLYRTFEQKIFKEHNSEGYAELSDKLYKIYITTLSISGFGLVLFSKEILLFFTSPQYYASEKYMVYLVIAVIISGMNTFFTTLLIADNKRRVVTFSSVAGGIISFITNLLLIKYFFTMGACIALILSFLTVYLFYINQVKLLHKYIIPQLSLVILFFCAAYLIPSSLSIVEDVVIKCLAMVLFVIYVLRIFNINLSFLNFSLLSIPKKRQ